MIELTRCPLCRSRRIRRVRETISFGKGTKRFTVPDLGFDRCYACREAFFGPEANEVIDRYQLRRRRRPRGRL